jgi:hypothetical protein
MSGFSNNDLFFEPKTDQYGSHMIMSNVRKVSKTKYVNIDTRFRDEYNYSQSVNYNVTIPERITDVKSMRVVSAEIPISFYNISLALGNSFFLITDTTPTSKVVTIPDGQYSTITLSNMINSQINAQYGSANLVYGLTGCVGGFDASGTSSYFTAKAAKNITVSFAVNSDGTRDKFNFKTKLGWLLGFRQPSYTINSTASPSVPTTVQSEALVDINGPRYLYLAIDEFNKGNQHSFIPPLHSSLVNKNIIARICLNKSGGYDYGRILPANYPNGLLVSDTRNYTGKIDLLKLNVQLLNENGLVMNLNGIDFSFCLEVVHE